jgi:hypothetical protein
MPFTCAICSLDIQVGELMLSDEGMNLAHKVCIDRLIKDPTHPSISIPSIYLSPPPPAPPSPPIDVNVKVSGSGFGNSTASIEPCLMPHKASVCSECGDRCIGMCPACLKYVCQSYGWNGKSCSLLHEAKCAGARESRSLGEKPPILRVVEIIEKSRNGKHKAMKPKKRVRR